MSGAKQVRQLLRTDGTVVTLERAHTVTTLAEMIGADTIDTVNLRHMGHPAHVMLVDDLGHTKQLPVNAGATRLYHLNCRPGTKHEIRGDVVIVPDEDFA